ARSGDFLQGRPNGREVPAQGSPPAGGDWGGVVRPRQRGGHVGDHGALRRRGHQPEAGGALRGVEQRELHLLLPRAQRVGPTPVTVCGPGSTSLRSMPRARNTGSSVTTKRSASSAPSWSTAHQE